MKKMFYLVLCLAMTFVFVFTPVSAAKPAPEEFVTYGIPVGGGIINTGYYAVKGVTTTGTEGNAAVECWIEYYNGYLQDSVTAYIDVSINEVATAKIQPLAWFADADHGTLTNSEIMEFTYIPDGGIGVTVYADNNFLTKGTAAHLVRYATLGEWCCGTTIIVG